MRNIKKKIVALSLVFILMFSWSLQVFAAYHSDEVDLEEYGCGKTELNRVGANYDFVGYTVVYGPGYDDYDYVAVFVDVYEYSYGCVSYDDYLQGAEYTYAEVSDICYNPDYIEGFHYIYIEIMSYFTVQHL